MEFVKYVCVVAACAGAVSVLWLFNPGAGYAPFWGLGLVVLWPLFRLVPARWRGQPTILEIGGLKWSMDDFCRGWLITGGTGTGKTTAAINRMLWQVSKNCPTWGGVCADDKGLYWETLSSMFRHLGRENDLILLQVRPEGAGPGWKPAHTFNFLEYSNAFCHKRKGCMP